MHDIACTQSVNVENTALKFSALRMCDGLIYISSSVYFMESIEFADLS